MNGLPQQIAEDRTREAYDKQLAEANKLLCPCGAHLSNGKCPRER